MTRPAGAKTVRFRTIRTRNPSRYRSVAHHLALYLCLLLVMLVAQACGGEQTPTPDRDARSSCLPIRYLDSHANSRGNADGGTTHFHCNTRAGAFTVAHPDRHSDSRSNPHGRTAHFHRNTRTNAFTVAHPDRHADSRSNSHGGTAHFHRNARADAFTIAHPNRHSDSRCNAHRGTTHSD